MATIVCNLSHVYFQLLGRQRPRASHSLRDFIFTAFFAVSHFTLRPSFIQISLALFIYSRLYEKSCFRFFFLMWLIANGSLYTSRAIWKRANCNHISKTVPWRVAHCTHAAEHNNQIIYGFNMLIMVLCKHFFSAAAITFCSQFNFQLGFVGILWFTFHFSFDELLSHKTSIRFKPLIFFWIFSFFYAFLLSFFPLFPLVALAGRRNVYSAVSNRYLSSFYAHMNMTFGYEAVGARVKLS